MGSSWLQHFQALQRCQCWRSQWLWHWPSAPGGEKQSREIAHPSLLCVFGDLLKLWSKEELLRKVSPCVKENACTAPASANTKYHVRTLWNPSPGIGRWKPSEQNCCQQIEVQPTREDRLSSTPIPHVSHSPACCHRPTMRPQGNSLTPSITGGHATM